MKTYIKSSYKTAHKNALPWYIKANQLHHASMSLRIICINATKQSPKIKGGSEEKGSESEKISNDILLMNQITMLFGFAVENLLKGIWIAQNKYEIPEDITKLNKNISNHNLTEIAQEIGIKLNENDKYILESLTQSIIWQGRYPIATNVQEYAKSFKKDAKPNYLIENNDPNTLPKPVVLLLDKIDQKIKEHS